MKDQGKQWEGFFPYNATSPSCFIYIRQHKLPQRYILLSWGSEEAPRRVPSYLQIFSRRKMFSENKRWVFHINCTWHETSGNKQYLIFRKESHTKMYVVWRWKFSQTLLNLLKKLLDTLDYQSDKTEVTGLAAVIDFLSVIHETGFKKHPKIQK